MQQGQGHDRGHCEGEGHVGLTLIADVRRSTVNVVDSLLETLLVVKVCLHNTLSLIRTMCSVMAQLHVQSTSVFTDPEFHQLGIFSERLQCS